MADDLLRFVAAPLFIVLGILGIIFRNPWSAAARNARRAKGDSERAIRSQSPRLFVVVGAFLVVWGVFVIAVPQITNH
jgi:hypothetical protein